MLAEGVTACPGLWQHLAYWSRETEELTSWEVLILSPGPSSSRSSFLSAGWNQEARHCWCVQKAGSFPSTFRVVSGRSRLSNWVIRLEDGSVRTRRWAGEAAVLLYGWAVWRRRTQHGQQPAARRTKPAWARWQKGAGWQPLQGKSGDFSLTRAVPATPGVDNDEWCLMKGCAAERNSSLNIAFPL